MTAEVKSSRFNIAKTHIAGNKKNRAFSKPVQS